MKSKEYIEIQSCSVALPSHPSFPRVCACSSPSGRTVRVCAVDGQAGAVSDPSLGLKCASPCGQAREVSCLEVKDKKKVWEQNISLPSLEQYYRCVWQYFL